MTSPSVGTVHRTTSLAHFGITRHFLTLHLPRIVKELRSTIKMRWFKKNDGFIQRSYLKKEIIKILYHFCKYELKIKPLVISVFPFPPPVVGCFFPPLLSRNCCPVRNNSISCSIKKRLRLTWVTCYISTVLSVAYGLLFTKSVFFMV